ncbi:hypothetical protein RRG08_061071 [Elysia crispata]|uniref:Uncharacterized protein n=1 Tax=Elysia crispata TaxID=231223 RepID=A0AAE0YVT7_9GAST|nr:hypothetical protein RRG08_061071 [Elysia crispata]
MDGGASSDTAEEWQSASQFIDCICLQKSQELRREKASAVPRMYCNHYHNHHNPHVVSTTRALAAKPLGSSTNSC